MRLSRQASRDRAALPVVLPECAALAAQRRWQDGQEQAHGFQDGDGHALFVL